jgi:hypothetical protein
MRGKLPIFLLIVLVLGFCGLAIAQSPIFVDQDFSGVTNPLTYLYQDPAVSQDSFAWSDPNDNVWGTARRGKSSLIAGPGTAERAYVSFNASSWGDADTYLEYTEDFNFAFDVNFSSFVATANDEDVALGLWYAPADAYAEQTTHEWYIRWANSQHFVGAFISEDGSAVNMKILFGNGGDWSTKSTSADLTGAGALSTGVNYRIEGYYRYDGTKYGQLFGELTNLDTNTVIGSIAQETIVQDTPDIYSAAYVNFTTDTANRQFTKLMTLGVGNWTWGTTQLAGPEFTSDNWLLTGTEPIPEPGVFGLISSFAGMILFKLRRKK